MVYPLILIVLFVVLVCMDRDGCFLVQNPIPNPGMIKHFGLMTMAMSCGLREASPFKRKHLLPFSADETLPLFPLPEIDRGIFIVPFQLL